MTPHQSHIYEMKRFSPIAWRCFFISGVVGVLALVPVAFNLSIYDQFIAAGTTTGLFMLSAGAVAALGLETLLRAVRARLLTQGGSRFWHVTSLAVFRKLIHAPYSQTERATLSSQMARMRDFEAIGEFAKGSLAPVVLELPLMLFYLGAMGFLGGFLICVPLGFIFIYALLLSVLVPRIRRLSLLAARAATQRSDFLIQSLRKSQTIRAASLERLWQEKWGDVASTASLAQFHAGFSAQILEISSTLVMTLGALATLSLGVHQTIAGTMTPGALIASVMLTWRILAPLQILCASFTRLRQLADCKAQMERVLASPDEQPASLARLKELTGALQFSRVTLRLSAQGDPALLGVSFDVQPGQIVAICGANGAGKSVLLKTALGLYVPQGGNVRIDGQDLRQLDLNALRSTLHYMPQKAQVPHGTVRDSLGTDLIDDDCYAALDDVDALEIVLQLPGLLDTDLSNVDANSIGSTFAARLALARALLNPAPLMLFDEFPLFGDKADVAFAKLLVDARGRSTVVFVTQRDDQIRAADQVLLLRKGELSFAGPTPRFLQLCQA